MKIILILFVALCGAKYVFAQQELSGFVQSATTGEKIAGASLTLRGTGVTTTSNQNGYFEIAVRNALDTLLVSHLSYETLQIALPAKQPLLVLLKERVAKLEEIEVNTGYYAVPRERVTGSFSHVDNQTLSRIVSTDITSRLEGVVGGLIFDTRNVTANMDNTTLRLRGLSTIEANATPLIVLDNFPFEGNIENINPNDIENITVLKDAAAASIWGARAGNGVIVITTKRGYKSEHPVISLNSNISISEMPDLFYNPNFIDSRNYIAYENEMFERGMYTENDRTPLNPLVELRIAERDGRISREQLQKQVAELESLDVRREAFQYLYTNQMNQQYNLSIRGGGNNYNYYVAGGYDDNAHYQKGNGNHRLTINSVGDFKLADRTTLSLGVAYINKETHSNAMSLSDIRPGNKTIYPYAKLENTDGSPASIVKDFRTIYVNNAAEMGLLDWQYRPLEERNLLFGKSIGQETRINIGLAQKIISGINIQLKYQFNGVNERNEGLRKKESYSVRGLVNRFTQADGTQVIPYGDILSLRHVHRNAHSGRIQIDYTGQFGANDEHVLSALGGYEVRQFKSGSNGFGLYGFDSDINTFSSQLDFNTRYPLRPAGTLRIPSLTNAITETIDRYISYYANIAYNYMGKYSLSASARKDMSNLFGVKSNQKGVPLWSMGVGWTLSDEHFFNPEWLPYLRFRTTIGVSGNVDKTVTAFPTAYYNTDALTGLRYGLISSPGNPALRWEKVKMLNVAVDFRSKHNRITGSVEYFVKNGLDLFGNKPIDPTTGAFIASDYYQRINYARLKTTGLDVAARVDIIKKRIRWSSNILFSYSDDKLIDFEQQVANIQQFVGVFPPPIKGMPLNRIYSYPWYGLNSTNGEPLVPVEGEFTNDYSAYLQSLTNDDLIYHGSAIPTLFGSIRNNIGFGGFDLAVNFTWKDGYYFRRSSIDYGQLYSQGVGHRDYNRRWKQPGDELITDVPSLPKTNNSNRDNIYNFSTLLVEDGAHLRLQDIYLGYTTDKLAFGRKTVPLTVYGYAKNLGILWRANKKGLDPDFPHAEILQPRVYSLGLKMNF